MQSKKKYRFQDLFYDFEIPAENTAAWRAEHMKYTRSTRWIAKSEIAKFIAGFTCTARLRGCLGDKNLQCHHVHYRKLWGEEIPGEDVVCVCANCHMTIHGRLIANDNEPDSGAVPQTAA